MSLTDPSAPDGAPNFCKFTIATTEPPAGQVIPESDNVPGGVWQGLAWNVENVDPAFANRPNGMHETNGWTILYGPCLFSLVCMVRVKQQTQGATLHLMARRAQRIDGENVIVGPAMEATEWTVFPHERHVSSTGAVTYSNTHLMTPMIEKLGPDDRLQIFTDMYWSDGTARVAGGTATILWWPTA